MGPDFCELTYNGHQQHSYRVNQLADEESNSSIAFKFNKGTILFLGINENQVFNSSLVVRFGTEPNIATPSTKSLVKFAFY